MELRRLLAYVKVLFLIGAITLVVTAILLPHPGDRPRSNRHSCFSNLKQMGIGMLMYYEDYDEQMPQASLWMDMTAPYIVHPHQGGNRSAADAKRSIYRCPALTTASEQEFGYAFNSDLQGRSLDKDREAQTVVIYDSKDLRWNANAPGLTGAANPPRHLGTDNVYFADGHVKPQTWNEIKK